MAASFVLSRVSPEANERLAAAVAAQGPGLRAFVRRQVADLAEAEDIVQDAFLELVAAARVAEPVRHVAAWLKRIARNRIIDRFRQRARADRLFDRPTIDDADDGSAGLPADAEARAPEDTRPDHRYEHDLFAAALVDALGELPPEQRDVFVAHELDGRSFKEISAATGTRVNTLLGRKHAAVLHLRSRLGDFATHPEQPSDD